MASRGFSSSSTLPVTIKKVFLARASRRRSAAAATRCRTRPCSSSLAPSFTVTSRGPVVAVLSIEQVRHQRRGAGSGEAGHRDARPEVDLGRARPVRGEAADGDLGCSLKEGLPGIMLLTLAVDVDALGARSRLAPPAPRCRGPRQPLLRLFHRMRRLSRLCPSPQPPTQEFANFSYKVSRSHEPNVNRVGEALTSSSTATMRRVLDRVAAFLAMSLVQCAGRNMC